MARVLVIDDSPSVCEVLRYGLEHAGHAVRISRDGASGMAAALENPPDLVILDLKMPGMDGTEVLRELKRLRPTLPVLFFTVFGDFCDNGILNEADGCFVKSADLGPLLEAVARLAGENAGLGLASPLG